MEFLGLILILGGFVALIMALVTLIRKKGIKRAWIQVGGGIIALIVGFVLIGNGSVAKEVEQEQAATVMKQQADEIKEFETKSKEFYKRASTLTTSTNGVVQDVEITDEEGFYQVRVFVKEEAWATSNESEKASFATSIKSAVQIAAVESGLGDKEKQFFVDFYSFENGDIVAEENTFSTGFDIKR